MTLCVCPCGCTRALSKRDAGIKRVRCLECRAKRTTRCKRVHKHRHGERHDLSARVIELFLTSAYLKREKGCEMRSGAETNAQNRRMMLVEISRGATGAGNTASRPYRTG